MKTYSMDAIRNIAVMGHGKCGKTTLTEAMLFNAKMTDRMGKVADGNTVTDYDGEEIKRQLKECYNITEFNSVFQPLLQR